MKKRIVNIVKILAFLLIGAILFWLVYRNQDIETIKNALKKANLWWLLVSIILGLLSHISRAIRWNMLINPIGYKARNTTLFYSVMIMYLTNYAIPRSGEVVRCGITSKYEKIPFTALLGTVVTERVIDFIMLFLLTFIVALTQFNVIVDFLNNNESAQQTVENLTSSVWLLVSILVLIIFLIILLVVFRKKIKQTKLFQKFKKLIDDFIAGIKSVASLEKKWAFIGHTIFIWTMYFTMIFIVFQAFDFTRHLGILAGLTVFVMSSFGMVFPSPGGIGSWHFMAIETLFIYGIDKTQASAFAFAAHESQMIMLIIVGLLALIATSVIKPKDSKIENFSNKN
jgi:uncharacterized protein (TIRG00374 family)